MRMKPQNQIVYVVNRSTEQLDCMADGVPIVLRPGYKLVEDIDPETGTPRIDPVSKRPKLKVIGAAPDGRVMCEPLPLGDALRCRRQHPVMGTEDPMQVNSADFLVAIPSLQQDYRHIEQSDSPEALDRSLLLGPGQRAVLVTQGRRKAPKPGTSGLNRGSVFMPELWNPAGIRTAY